MVQVIYEEHEDEYWAKPLRDAITSIGNSWAGGIIRRQNHAANYANAAANRAHEAYIAQIGINSREKISANTLAATQSRNATLNKQYEATAKLAQDREKREADQWAYQKTNDLHEINATAASQEMLSSMDRLRVDEHGNIVTTKLSKERLKELNALMAKSPAVAKAYQPAVQDYFKRQKVIAGRLQMLQMLQKTKGNENAISRILNEQGPVPIDIAQLRGGEGTKEDQRLQALSGQIRDDGTWANILASYKIDKVTAEGLKSHEYKNLIRHSVVLGDNDLDTGKHAFKKGDQNQIARTEGYHNSKDTLSGTKLFTPGHVDTTALMSAVNNMGDGYKNVGQNTAEYVGGAVVDFMQEHTVYFTNPSKVAAAIRRRMIQVANAGPEAKTEPWEETPLRGPNKGKPVMRPAHDNLQDPTNKAIHGLMFDPGNPADKRKVAREIMLKFLEGEGWHKGTNAQIRSSVTKRPEDKRAIADLFEGGGASNIADTFTTERTGTENPIVQNQNEPIILPGDQSANAAMSPNTQVDDFGSFTNKAGLKGGYLSDALNRPVTTSTISGLADGIVTLKDGTGERGTIDLRRIPVADLNHIMFSGLTRNDEGGTLEKEFWTEKLRGMRAAALATNKEGLQNVNEWAPGTQKLDKPSPNKSFRNLQELYQFNAEIGMRQLLLPKYREALFSINQQTGQQSVKGWVANLLPPVSQGSRVGTATNVLMDWDYIEEKLGKGSSDLKQFEAIFEAMNINKEERDDGSYFGTGNRLRRLAYMMQQMGQG